MKRYLLQIKYLMLGGFWILILYKQSSLHCKNLIQEDISAIYGYYSTEQLLKVLFEDSRKSFRNILYFRFLSDGCSNRLYRISRFMIRPVESIEIGGEIDGGFKIMHKYCVINVKKAGKNLMVSQGVTIGKNVGGGTPVLGDNVLIYSNAVVYGDIKIGDNVMIGAGSVVNKDIPAGSVVVGNPCRIIRKNI